MNYPYNISISTAAATAAVDTTFVKAHCRIDISDDDTLIAGYIAAATALAETYTKRAFINTQFKLTIDTLQNRFYPSNGIIYLPRADVVTVDSFKYIDHDGVQRTLPNTDYTYSTGVAARLLPAYNKSWPNHRYFFESIEIKFTAGYGAAATNVPFEAKLAIAHIVDHWYNNRSSVEAGSFNEIPQNGFKLLDTISWSM